MLAFAQDSRKRLFSYSSETHTSSPRIASASAHSSQRVLFTACSCFSRSISSLSPMIRDPHHPGYNAETRTERVCPEEPTISLNCKGSPSNQWFNIYEQHEVPMTSSHVLARSVF